MIPVVDIFAGPGGLNEGFSSIRDSDGKRVFNTVLSIEMESSAVKTLTLRAAHRFLTDRPGGQPQIYRDYLAQDVTYEEMRASAEVADAFSHAETEVRQFELSEVSRPESDELIRKALPAGQEWVLIGGPPCQAYSLAGRSRRKHDETFKDDHKHFLYREYLHIITEFRPAVFVMENVKGMLSSKNGDGKIFELIEQDLREPGYDLHSMVVSSDTGELKPTDFIIKSEQYGIPQKRHRVIIVGLRRDAQLPAPKVLEPREPVTVHDAIWSLPRLRSGISRRPQSTWEDWAAIRNQAHSFLRAVAGKERASAPDPYKLNTKSTSVRPAERFDKASAAGELQAWLRNDAAPATWNHEARGHMIEDLERYYLLASLVKADGLSPKVRSLPTAHWPKHNNINNLVVPFEDRFRVQVWGKPSSTVVSHIAKDGHYYIHPDPEQMRSLTVREAARLQTFPDNYVFLGNRTQQYTQVGNAVPPLLAAKIAERIAEVLV
ncbi:DNA cytosine methyltransferase [Arthrobacter caoxuetaonis]|uniref:DNA cytosine methyltransferase n=1 Tax=Arthrobacter caoxuetaonis TaxID=2886935 RepID=UPI001D156ADA|nr:DNA cytosine methyltransferase [Arthrobacter caoxuetaonis]MCC3282075.1 DNA cytosine methyltransferase [Arthrobacter caoxuetaonis]